MSVQSGSFWDETFICATSASLATNQFCAVSLSTGLIPTGVGAVPSVLLTANATQGVNGAIGVLQNDPTGGRAAIVRLFGTTKMVSTTSAAVTYGSLVTSTTDGRAMVADTSGQRVIGQCISPSTTQALGVLVEVMMFPRPICGLV